MSRKISILTTSLSAGVFALGVAAITAAPTFAATEAWQEVQVTTTEELVLTGGLSDETVLSPTATGGAVSNAASALSVRGNVAWKLQWQAVDDEYTDESTTAAGGTFLTATGFGATAANASLAYQGTNAVASGTNVWSAQLAATGTGNTLTFTALPPTAATIWTGSSTIDSALTPTYSADIDSTLNHGTYYGTIYYTLSKQ